MFGDRDQLRDLQGPLLRGMVQHLRYLKRVENTLAGHDDFASTAHTECALGRILVQYHPLVPDMLPEPLLRSWESLDRQHQEFHASSGRALAGDFSAVDSMEVQSLRIVELLGSLEQEIDSLVNA